MEWLIEITYRVYEKGGFLQTSEAMKFIPAYLIKHAVESIKPQSFETNIHTGYTCAFYYFTLSFKKEFSDYSDVILWVDEVEGNLEKYFEKQQEIFHNARLSREKHTIFKLKQKRSFFSTKNVWVQV